MILENHKERGKKVWLTDEEIQTLISHTEDTEQRIALGLAGRCGLRSDEIVAVSPQDIVDGDAGAMLRVWQGKGGKYRETPVPGDLRSSIDAMVDVRPEPADAPVVDRTTRCLRKWISRARERCQSETDDVGWQFVSMHDLRRSWGQQLVEANIEPGMIMVWGGWEDWETFREHYLGQYSPRAQRRARQQVPWLRDPKLRPEEEPQQTSQPRYTKNRMAEANRMGTR